MSETTDARAAIERMWRRDATAERLGITLSDASPGAVTLEMEVTEDHLGHQGQLHGGVLFTLADVGMAYASNSHGVDAMATSARIDFVDRAGLGDRLVAEACEHGLRGRSGIYDVTIRVEGRLIATFRGTTLQLSS